MKEIESKHVLEKKMVQLFELATIIEIINYVRSIIRYFRGLWKKLSEALKN